LLLVNPRKLRLKRKHFDGAKETTQDGDFFSGGLKDRLSVETLKTTMNGLSITKFFPDTYEPRTEEGKLQSLENFLLTLEEDKLKEGKFWAPAFDNNMESLVMSSKLFVQDCIATGKSSLVAEDIFALHLYTLQSSIFREANGAMRDVDEKKIILWRPFIYYLLRALKQITVHGGFLLRGIKLGRNKDGTVGDFLDGKYNRTEPNLAARYYPGSVILWPAFSSTTLDRRIALGYSTNRLKKEDAAVIFKIYSRSARSIRDFSYYPFEDEYLYKPNTTFRVKGFCEPTVYNLQDGMDNNNAVHGYKFDTEMLYQRHLSLDEARKEQKIVIILCEESAEELIVSDPEALNDSEDDLNSSTTNKENKKNDSRVVDVISLEGEKEKKKNDSNVVDDANCFKPSSNLRSLWSKIRFSGKKGN